VTALNTHAVLRESTEARQFRPDRASFASRDQAAALAMLGRHAEARVAACRALPLVIREGHPTATASRS
jgi:Flp pilus assembly protein TadD